MATDKTKTAIKTFIQTFASTDDQIENVIELKPREEPQRPRGEAALEGKVIIYLIFPPTNEEGRYIGPGVPRDEIGAFLVHVVAPGRSTDADDRAGAVAKALKDALFNQTIDDVDIEKFIGSSLAFAFRGAFSGRSFSVQFETQNV